MLKFIRRMGGISSQFTGTQTLVSSPGETYTVKDVRFKWLNRVNFADLAYLSVDKFGEEDFMLLSQMDVGRGASLGLVRGLKSATVDYIETNLQTHTLDPSPYRLRSVNKAEKVPDDVFPGECAILVPDGFLIPGRRDGNVYLML